MRVGHRQPGQGGRGERRSELERHVRLERADGPRGAASVPLAMASGDLEWLDGGVTAVAGVLAGGSVAGIKPGGEQGPALNFFPTPARGGAGSSLEHA